MFFKPIRMIDKNKTLRKNEDIIQNLRELGSLIGAFSGGVDSFFLLALSSQILGDRVMAATADSIIHPSRERDGALRFTRERGIRQIVFKSDEFNIPEFVANDRDRCYYCKMALCRMLKQIAKKEGIKHIAHGANADDFGDYRPGFRAAVEMGLIYCPAYGCSIIQRGDTFPVKRNGPSLVGQTGHGVPRIKDTLRRRNYG